MGRQRECRQESMQTDVCQVRRATAVWSTGVARLRSGADPVYISMMEELRVLDAARAVLDALERGTDIAIVAVVEPRDSAGRRLLVTASRELRGSLGEPSLDAKARGLGLEALSEGGPILRAVATPNGQTTLYVEPHRAPDSLIIVGAGHIAVPLARLGVALGFSVTVLDDRDEFATDTRFAAGVRVVRSDFTTDPFAGVTIDARSYLALVTRGHRWDFDCLQRLLGSRVRPRYIGMIGSRRRVRAAFQALLEAGVPRAELARVHAPIGLEIGAETPEEIAVSIAAELIAVRRGADTAALTDRERVLERLLPQR